jgi:hypothetical protein
VLAEEWACAAHLPLRLSFFVNLFVLKLRLSFFVNLLGGVEVLG